MAQGGAGEASGDATVELAASEVSLTPAVDGGTSRPALTSGEGLGRYVVLEQLGAGGMGFVVRAYDPKLHREVALKRLHPHTLDALGSARLVREAQAMAQLSHPNVVAVYDVDADDDGVTVAMEFVPGRTLRRWLKDTTRSPDEILAVFVAAGRGLGAAHRAGIVHRDFKPGNVLVGEDGVVKVTDFGLAKPTNAAVGLASNPGTGDVTSGRVSGDDWDSNLTAVDTVLGTPRYMAPEHHVGEAPAPAADQYGFCIALWEALCGSRPFSADSLQELLRRKEDGPPPWPKQVVVERRIVDAIMRGLAPDPADRWPTMDELLGALAPDPARRRRRWAWAASGLAVVGIGSGAVTWSLARAERCSGAAAQLAETWGDPQRDTVRRAMVDTGLPYAADTADAVVEELDAYGQTWIAQHTDACEATAVRSEQSAELMDLRMACLHRARVELGASVQVLVEADADLVEDALTFAQRLPALSRCEDVAALRAEVPPPGDPQTAAAVESVRDELAMVRSQLRAGRVAQGVELARAADERARAIDYPPLQVEADLAMVSALSDDGDVEGAEARARQALRTALTIGATRAAAEAATVLAFTLGNDTGQPVEALAYSDVAMGLAIGVEPTGALEGSALNARGSIFMAKGDYREAEPLFRRNLELQLRLHDESHADVVSARNNIAALMYQMGRYDEAIAEFRRIVALRVDTLGPRHPATVRSRANLASALLRSGKPADAEHVFRELIEVQAATLGAEHPDVGMLYMNLSSAHQAQHRTEDAADSVRRAIEIWTRAYSPDHPRVAEARTNLANGLNVAGEYEAAIVEYRRSLAVFEKVDPDHPNLTNVLTGLGAALLDTGQEAEAVASFRRCLEIATKAFAPAHAMVGDCAGGLATALEKQGGHEAEVLELRETAWRAYHDTNSSPDRLGNAALWLGELLADGDPARARELATEARAAYEALGDAQAIADADALLRRLDRPG